MDKGLSWRSLLLNEMRDDNPWISQVFSLESLRKQEGSCGLGFTNSQIPDLGKFGCYRRTGMTKER